MSTLNIDAYLKRIGFVPQCGEEDPTEKLIRLHSCHSFTVPFEDFDCYCRVPFTLNLDDIFEKVVTNRRGGYCFEINKLFHELLKEMGYSVRAILCRAFSAEGARLSMTHRLIEVTIDGTVWLADVGLGGNGWIAPLKFEVGVEQEQYGRTYRIVSEPNMGYLVERKVGDNFVSGVAFGFQYADESDFELSNFFTSTHPDSAFLNRMMCTLPTPDARYVIRDNMFRIVNARGEQQSEEMLTPSNFNDIVSRYFGITLTAPMYDYIHAKLKG